MVKNSHKIYGIAERVELLYKNNARQEQSRIIMTGLRTIELVAKLLSLMYAGAVFLFLMSPAYKFFFENERTLIFTIYFPLIDHKTTKGYVFTFLIQILLAFYALIGVSSFDVAFFTYSYHCAIFAETFHLDLKLLTEKLEGQVNDESTISKDAKNMTFKKILLQYNSLVE